jgi:hypothetical protein
MLLTSLAFAGLLLAAPPSEPKPAATAKLPLMTVLQNGKKTPYGGGLMTYVEGLSLAILGSCTADVSAGVGKDRWTKALAENHVRIVYDQPRPTGMQASNETEVLQMTELLIPVSAASPPDFILVREGPKYRAFSKFSYATTQVLRKYLEDYHVR